MLRIDNNNNIFLTKGDSGIINIKLDSTPAGYDVMEFYVRQAQNLDNVLISIVQGVSSDYGQIAYDSGTGIYTLTIFKAATENMKRRSYVYDFKLSGTNVVTTFIGGDVSKNQFTVT